MPFRHNDQQRTADTPVVVVALHQPWLPGLRQSLRLLENVALHREIRRRLNGGDRNIGLFCGSTASDAGIYRVGVLGEIEAISAESNKECVLTVRGHGRVAKRGRLLDTDVQSPEVTK